MLTQHQVRKYAKVERFEKLTLIDDMIKALKQASKNFATNWLRKVWQSIA
jgi:hypothetical protein